MPPESESVVLVVDDNAAGRYATCRILEAAGFKTLQSAGGAEALQLAKSGVAALVLDVHLPDLMGFEVCRMLRSQLATTLLPIIHLSAVHVEDEDRVTGLTAGADAYYTSPVEPSVLVATLRALIHARGLMANVRRSERRYRGFFDEAPLGVMLMDESGRIVDANAELSRLLQWPREQLANKLFSSLLPPELVVEIETVRATWKSQSWSGQFPLLTRSGARIGLAWNCGPHSEPGWSIAMAQALDVRARAARPS